MHGTLFESLESLPSCQRRGDEISEGTKVVKPRTRQTGARYEGRLPVPNNYAVMPVLGIKTSRGTWRISVVLFLGLLESLFQSGTIGYIIMYSTSLHRYTRDTVLFCVVLRCMLVAFDTFDSMFTVALRT